MLLLGGCARTLPPLPLRLEPVAFADTLPIPEPGEQEENRIIRILTVQAPYDMAEPFKVPEGEALNRTHMDDAVSSAWWERRMGYREVTPEELVVGHLLEGGAPDMEGELQVTGAKIGGVTAGFQMKDAKGDRFIIKFDHPDWPYLQSSVGVIVNRLMWGAGYWVPDDYVTMLDSANLTVDEGAEVDVDGVERPMTMDDVREVLKLASPLPNGRFRVVASKFVPGIPKGTIMLSATRADDPNDHFRHEHRRELRGLRMISAWLNNTDAREGNTMDVYIDPPGYLRHYIIDFAAALGSSTDRAKHPKDDVERPADFWRSLKRIATLGFYKEGWEDYPHLVPHPEIGYVKSEVFDPDEWKAAWDNPAFFAMTEADGYWAAKIVSAFTDAHIRAAVETGELPSAELEDTLTEVISLRRDRVVQRYFSSVTPLEEARVEGSRGGGFTLSFEDLGLDRGVWQPGATHYAWSLSHPARGIDASGEAPARAGAQSLAITVPAGASAAELEGEEALAQLRVLAVRDVYHMDDEEPRAATVWLRWDGRAGAYQVVGLEH